MDQFTIDFSCRWDAQGGEWLPPVFHAVFTEPLFNGTHGNNNNETGYFTPPSTGPCSPNPVAQGVSFNLAPVGSVYDGSPQILMTETSKLPGNGDIESGSCVAAINTSKITDKPTYTDVTSVNGLDMVTNQVDCSGQPSPISFQDSQLPTFVGGTEYTYVYGDSACVPSDWRLDATGGNSGYAMSTSTPGSGWSSPSGVDATKKLAGVNCPSTSLCVAVDASGNVATTTNPAGNPPTWSVVNIDGSNDITAVSCSGTSFCLAVDSVGNALVSTNPTGGASAWSKSTADGTNDITSVSCPSTSLCVIGDTKGNVVSWNGTSFTSYASNPITPNVNGTRVGLSAISCEPNSACIMADSNGDTYSWYGTTWTTIPSTTVGNIVDAISCATVTMCVAVDQSGNAAMWNGSTWTSPVSTLADEVDNGHLFSGVSCTSNTFCMAVDSHGNAFINNGSTWSAPVIADSNGGLASVSCTSASFCVAVDSSGYETTYTGTWTAPLKIDSSGGLTSVSCVNLSFCIAVDSNGYAFKWDGTNWYVWTTSGWVGISNTTQLKLTPPLQIDPNGWLTSVSCPTSSFCAAVDKSGNVIIYSGSSWSTPVAVDPSILSSISCTSSSMCVAVDLNGNVATSVSPAGGSSSWKVSGIDIVAMESVSCYVSSPNQYCVSVDHDGNAIYGSSTDSGSTWSWSSSNIDGTNQLTSVSCSGTGPFCIAVDGRRSEPITWPDYAYVARVQGGDLTQTNMWSYYYYGSNGAGTWSTTGVMPGIVGATWSNPAAIDTTNKGLSSVSCATSTFCVAVDSAGYETTYTGTWSTPSKIDTNGGLTSISCTSSTFCVAVDSAGYETTYTGTWSAPSKIDTNGGLTSVSCPSSGFCAAVDSSGHSVAWTGSSWNSPVDLDSNNWLESVSCPSSYYCIAVDASGNAITWNFTSVSSLKIDNKGNPTSISCATSNSCVVVDNWGYEMSWDGANWSSNPIYLDSASGLSSVTCPTSDMCVAVDKSGNEFTFGNGQWMSGPTAIDGTTQLTGVSCINTGFCQAIDSQGYALTASNVTIIQAGALIDGSVSGGNMPIEDGGGQLTVEAVAGGYRMVDGWDGALSTRIRYGSSPEGPFVLADAVMLPESTSSLNYLEGNSYPPAYGMAYVSSSDPGSYGIFPNFVHEVPALESGGDIVLGYDVNLTVGNDQGSGIINNFDPRFVALADNG